MCTQLSLVQKPCLYLFQTMHSLKPCILPAFFKTMHSSIHATFQSVLFIQTMHASKPCILPVQSYSQTTHSLTPCIHPALSFSRPSIPPNHTFPNSCNAVPMRQCSYISKLSLPNSYENLSRCAVTGSNALSLYLYISSLICRSRNRPRITHIVWSIPLHQLCSYPP